MSHQAGCHQQLGGPLLERLVSPQAQQWRAAAAASLPVHGVSTQQRTDDGRATMRVITKSRDHKPVGDHHGVAHLSATYAAAAGKPAPAHVTDSAHADGAPSFDQSCGAKDRWGYCYGLKCSLMYGHCRTLRAFFLCHHFQQVYAPPSKAAEAPTPPDATPTMPPVDQP